MKLIDVITVCSERLNGSAGPVFEKELRMASRRGRYYWQRIIYGVVLLLCVGVAWHGAMDVWDDDAAAQVARMAEVGRTVAVALVWLQCIAAMVVSVQNLSDAIGREVATGTLGVLVTTPLTNRQIVVGKLAGGLLHVVTLLAVSLPVLAIVRVFGGVSWQFVIAGVCVTLTGALLAGMLSLHVGINQAQSRKARGRAGGMLMFWYVFLPWIGGTLFSLVSMGVIDNVESFFARVAWLPPFAVVREWAIRLYAHTSPFMVLATLSEQLYGSQPITLVNWPVHCLVMLGATGLLMVSAVWKVRGKAMLALTQGVQKAAGARRQGEKASLLIRIARRTSNSAMVPRELIRQQTSQKPWVRRLSFLGMVVIIGTAYAVSGYYRAYRFAAWHTAMNLAYFVLAALYAMGLSAEAIISEKERRSWPILLTTTLSDRQIVMGKAAAVLYRLAPIGLLMVVHLLVFCGLGYMHPLVVLHTATVAPAAVLAVVFLGLFMSSVCKRLNSARNWTLGILVAPFILGPCVISPCMVTGGGAAAVFTLHPIVQVGMATASLSGESLRQSRSSSDFIMDAGVGVAMIVYVLGLLIACVAAAMLAAITTDRVRQNIYPASKG